MLISKQLKRSFSVRYSYGESANTIKILFWVDAHRKPTTDGHAEENQVAMFHIILMYYINCYMFFEQLERD